MLHLDRHWPGLTLGLLLAAPHETAGQVVGGVVVEQVAAQPARGAVVTLFRERAGPSSLEPSAVTTADETGAFIVAARGPGTYRAQASVGGLTSPLTPPFHLAASDTLLSLNLVVPSRLLHMAYDCGAEGAVVVGVVRDEATEVVLPGAHVTASWQDGSTFRWQDVEADAEGRYRICGVSPTTGKVRLQAELLGRRGEWGEVALDGPAVLFHDIALAVRAGQPERSPDVVRDRILMEAAARTLGDLSGQIHDQRSGAPMPYALVRVQGTSHQALTDAEGRFIFEGFQPGTYVLEIWNLGNTVRSDPVEVPAGQNVFVGLQVAPRAVELEGIEVTARSAAQAATRLTPFRLDLVYGETMAKEEQRGARAFEILRRASPGLRVQEVYPERGLPWVCVESNRRVQRLIDVPECEQVEVIVDGVRAPDASQLLRSFPASEIESIEFLPAIEAQQAYGPGGNTANGAVVIYTRGRGPYVSPLRNKR